MIADLLPEYYSRCEPDVRYEVLRSIVIDGHEVAWMSYAGEFREGKPFYGRTMMCECDFTEGIGWNIGEDGQRYTVHGKDARATCLIRGAAMHLRHLELRQEYHKRFVQGSENFFLGLKGCIREITLDLIKKAEAGEWLEDGDGAAMYGGYFYIRTLAAITGECKAHLWEDIHPLIEGKLIGVDGSIVTFYTEPPPPLWTEAVRVEDDGWVGIASLPGHRRMAQEWKFTVLNPAGKEAVYAPGQRLLHDPAFGPDVEDVRRAERTLREMIEECRQRN